MASVLETESKVKVCAFCANQTYDDTQYESLCAHHRKNLLWT